MDSLAIKSDAVYPTIPSNTEPLVLPTNHPYHSVELQLHDFRVMAETLDALGHTRAAVEIYTTIINRYENLDCFPQTMSRSIRIKRGACNARLGRLAEAEEDLTYVSKLPLSSATREPLKKERSRLQHLRSLLSFRSTSPTVSTSRASVSP